MDKKRTGQSLKDLLKQNTETSSKVLKRQDSKTSKRQSAKTSSNETKPKRHTIYLSPEKSKKLRLYAVENEMQLSEVIEELIDKKL